MTDDLVTPGEPGGWELQRALKAHSDAMNAGFAALNARLDKLVSTDAYVSDQRRIDERITALAEKLSAERQARVEAVAFEREARTLEINAEVAGRRKAIEDEATSRSREVGAVGTRMDKGAVWIRWLAASIAIPVALFLGTLYLQRGGA